MGGVRGDNSVPVGQSVAMTNGGNTAIQKQQEQQKQQLQQQYQQQANSYSVAAANSDQDIQKSKNLALAKINATAAGIMKLNCQLIKNSI